MGKIEVAPKPHAESRFRRLFATFSGLVIVAGIGTAIFLRSESAGKVRAVAPPPMVAAQPPPIAAVVSVPSKTTEDENAPSPPVPAPEKPASSSKAVGDGLEIISFGTRPYPGAYQECFGEVKNVGVSAARFVKVSIRCLDRGQVYVDSTYVEPETLQPGTTGTFKTYVRAPQGTEWTAEIEGSGKRVPATDLSSSNPESTAATSGLPAVSEPAPTALFSVDKWRSWYTECCIVVAGSVYNRGMAAGHAQVSIVGFDRDGAVVETGVAAVEPYEVPPKSLGHFEKSFVGSPAQKWEVEIVEKTPGR